MGSEQGSIMKEHSPNGHVVLKEVPLEFNNEGKTSQQEKKYGKWHSKMV